MNHRGHLSSDGAWWLRTQSGPSLSSVTSEAWALTSCAFFIPEPWFPPLLSGDRSSACPVGLLGLKLNCVESQRHVLMSPKQGCL